jgi:hypothetical protein
MIFWVKMVKRFFLVGRNGPPSKNSRRGLDYFKMSTIKYISIDWHRPMLIYKRMAILDRLEFEKLLKKPIKRSIDHDRSARLTDQAASFICCSSHIPLPTLPFLGINPSWETHQTVCRQHPSFRSRKRAARAL